MLEWDPSLPLCNGPTHHPPLTSPVRWRAFCLVGGVCIVASSLIVDSVSSSRSLWTTSQRSSAALPTAIPRPWATPSRPTQVLRATSKGPNGGGGDGPFGFLSRLTNQAGDLFKALAAPMRWPYEMPMKKLHLPREDFIGGDYFLLPLNIGDNPNIKDFIIDSALTGSVITSKTVQDLALQPLTQADLKEMAKSSALDEVKIRPDLIVVRDISINSTVAVMSTVMAEVNFYEAAVGKRLGTPVAGMLGMDFLGQFDIDFDHSAEKLRLWPHGMGLKEWKDVPQTVPLQGITLPGNLFGIKVFFSLPEDWVPDPSLIPAESSKVQYNTVPDSPVAAAAARIAAAGAAEEDLQQQDGNATVLQGKPSDAVPAKLPSEASSEAEKGVTPSLDTDASSNKTDLGLSRLDRLLDSILETLPKPMDDANVPLAPSLSAVEPKVGRPRPPEAPAAPAVVTRLGKAIASIDSLIGDEPVGGSKNSANATSQARMRPYKSSPMPGIVALGSPFTIINWEAAGALGIRKGDPRIQSCPFIDTVGLDGKHHQLPLIRARANLCTFTPSTVMKAITKQYSWRLEGMAINNEDPCVSFPQDLLVAIGDEQFEQLLAVFPFGKYGGPVAMIGQDVLQQRRLRLSARNRVLIFEAEEDRRRRPSSSPSPAPSTSWLRSIMRK